MGCDIHVRLEVRNHNGVWEPCELYEKNKYYDPNCPKDYERKFEVNPVYSGRNYDLFSALCGVRSQNVPMISEPRGLPEDVTQEFKDYSASWGCDGHSRSWNTLAELYAYQETHKTVGMFDCDVMGTLISNIENQVERVAYIWNPKEKARDIRIVYFFDN